MNIAISIPDPLAALRAENDELRERVSQLEAALGRQEWSPEAWGLSRQESRIICCLALRELAVMEILKMAAATPGGIEPGPQDIHVHICRIRRKLARFGIEIKTRWGVGYFLEAETRKRVRAELGA